MGPFPDWLFEGDGAAAQGMAIAFAIATVLLLVVCLRSFRQPAIPFGRNSITRANNPRFFWVAYAINNIFVSAMVGFAGLFLIHVFLLDEPAMPDETKVVDLESGDSPLGPVITLPLAVHLARNFEVLKHDVRMTTWITPDNLRESVLPEINRIWWQAGIRWTLVDVDIIEHEMPALNDLVAALVAARTRSEGRQDEEALRLTRRYANNLRLPLDRYHLIVFPFMGNGASGVAYANGVGVVGAWVDRSTPFRSPLAQVNLTAARGGSFTRTAAHELGHFLGLDHEGCKGDCLMRPSRGFHLSERETTTARERAQAKLVSR